VAQEECPYLVGIYGYATDQAFVNYSAILCRAQYQQVDATVTFDLPNYVPSKTAPMIVDESSVKVLKEDLDSNSMLNSLTYLGFYNQTETTLNGQQLIDPITAALIYGKDGISMEQVFQSELEEFLVPSLRRLVRLGGAQYMSYFYRSANSSLAQVGLTTPATLEMGPTYRLKQSATSTRILDGLLAASALCSIWAILTFRYRDVAKAQLGSLAAVLALVADSTFVRNLRDSAPSQRDALAKNRTAGQRNANILYMQQRLAAEGSFFSLGWRTDPVSVPLGLSETEGPTQRRRWGIDEGPAEG
jgi:hypothetical protein